MDEVVDALTNLEIKETPALPASSGALVKYGNKLLLYSRDNNKNIPHPGKFAIFGGEMEESVNEEGIKERETVNRALKREIGEELGIQIDDEQVTNLGVLEAGDDNDHIKNISLVELTKGQAENVVKGGEGHQLRWMTIGQIKKLRGDEYVPDLKVFLKDHVNALERWLNRQNVTASELGLRAI